METIYTGDAAFDYMTHGLFPGITVLSFKHRPYADIVLLDIADRVCSQGIPTYLFGDYDLDYLATFGLNPLDGHFTVNTPTQINLFNFAKGFELHGRAVVLISCDTTYSRLNNLSNNSELFYQMLKCLGITWVVAAPEKISMHFLLTCNLCCEFDNQKMTVRKNRVGAVTSFDHIYTDFRPRYE